MWLISVCTIPALTTLMMFIPQLHLNFVYFVTVNFWILIEYVGIVGASCALIVCFLPVCRRQGARFLILCWALASVNYFGDIWSHSIRAQTFGEVERRAAVLLHAIAQYKSVNNRAPESLQELVPRYIACIPSTGIPRCPAFSYEKASAPEGERWELGVVNYADHYYDDFRFRSSGVFLPAYGCGFQGRIGDWYYMHD